MLDRSQEALDDAKWGRDQLVAAQNDERAFRRWYRVTITLLAAVGPTVNSETPGQPKDWWGSLLPEAGDLMELREAVLKETKTPLKSAASFDAQAATHSRLGSATRQRPRPRTVGRATTVTQAATISETGEPIPSRVISGEWVLSWTIVGGGFDGQDPAQVIDRYLARLENDVLPEAKQRMGGQ